jgi:predicted nucleic acid-binding Zn ribbon protein
MPRVLASLHVETKMKNMQIIEKWPDIVGAKIAQHTRATAADADNLFVEVDNPVWQSQLFLMKNEILQRIKKYGVTIRDIKLCIKKKES